MTRRNTPDVAVRHVEPDDVDAIASLLRQRSVIDGTMRLPHAPLEASMRRVEHDASRIRLVAVDRTRTATDPDRVLGLAELQTYPHAPRHRHVGELDLLAVNEIAQGQGIGRRLLSEIVDLADRWLQLTRLGLVVWTDNGRAISLYEQYGFRIEGTMPSYAWRNGAPIDAHVMGRVQQC